MTLLYIVLKYVDDKTTTEDDGKTYTPYKIKISLVFANQANHAYFDHIQLIKDVAQSYVYDKDGNLVTVSANAEQKNNMAYDGEDNLVSYKDALGYETTFNYQEGTHNLTEVTTPKGVKTQYSYNDKGQVIAVENVNTGGAAKIRSTNTYTDPYKSGNTDLSAGAYLYQTTNELGKTTTYGHHLPTGAQSSVTDANGNKTIYTYDDNYSRLQKVTNGNTAVTYDYANNQVTSIVFSGGGKQETYGFVYDNFGNVIQTKVGNTVLSTKNYDENNGILEESTYANGDSKSYDYNKSGLVTEIKQYDNSDTQYNSFTWDYSINGTAREHTDGYTDLRYVYSYDSIGRLIRTDISNNLTNAYVGSSVYGYDIRNNLVSLSNNIGGITYTQQYSYSNIGTANSETAAKDNLPTKYTALGKSTIYTYNSLNQLADRNVDTTTDINTHYVYNTVTLDGNLYYTNQLNCEILNGTSYHYTYDDVGNIIAIKKGTGYGSTTSDYKAYSYDNKYQLTGETMGSTVNSWSYDALGNILSKTTSVNGATTNTVTYGYGADSDCGWENLLTNITIKNYTDNTEITETINYDAIGNPLLYRGANLSWYGRQLTAYSKGGTNASFTYDASGLRSTKTVNGVKTTYQYVGDQLLYEDRGNGTKLYYFYDSNGILSAIYHHVNGVKTAYHVQTNYQGDVVALYDWSGSLVAKYDYDAWGNILSVTDANGTPITSSTHIANVNPFRYRSYYYDNDLGLYYLQSRYYDSGIGRFVNGDEQLNDDILGNNLFVYCSNNPITRCDDTGKAWWIVVGAIVGCAFGAGGRILTNVCTGQKWNTGVIGAAVGGAVGGALAAAGHPIAAAYVGAAVESLVNEGLSYTKASKYNGTKQKKFTIENVVNSGVNIGKDALVNGSISMVTNAAVGRIVPNISGDFKPLDSVAFLSPDTLHCATEALWESTLIASSDIVGNKLPEKPWQSPTIQIFPDEYVEDVA